MDRVSKDCGITSITRMWSSLESSGLERFRLLSAADKWKLQGTLLRVHAGQAIEARYLVECDSHWHTIKAEVEVRADRETRTLLLEQHGGLWVLNGKATSEFEGCLDVDLAWTPSTNTLPIRRLGLDNQKIAVIDAVWISFPDLSLERLRQSYEAVGDRTYCLTTGAGAFKAEIAVDQHGIVHEYKGHWKTVL